MDRKKRKLVVKFWYLACMNTDKIRSSKWFFIRWFYIALQYRHMTKGIKFHNTLSPNERVKANEIMDKFLAREDRKEKVRNE